MVHPEGYKQCAVVASDRALGEPGSHPSRRPQKKQAHGLLFPWYTIVHEVRTIIQADILDNLGQKEASML